MSRKQTGAATELASVDPEPHSAEPRLTEPASPPSRDPGAPAAAGSTAGDAAASEKSEPAPLPGHKAAPGDANATEDDRPPPPPRPRPERRVSGFSTNLAELRAAFPQEQEGVLRAVLVAASNNLEAAFTGMLALTDPTIRPAAYITEQIERDARLARRLAASESQQPRPPRRDRRREPRARDAPRRVTQGDVDNDMEGDVSDDLYDGFQRGFADTKQAVSSFWGSLKQRISNDIYDEDDTSAYYPDGREAPRDQWWPRQGDRQHSPPLPPRKSSRASVRDDKAKAGTAREGRSVNAFGDELGAPRKQWEPVQANEPEPDAFFIGDSDDDELGSLNDGAPSADAKGADKEAAASALGSEDGTAKRASETAEETPKSSTPKTPGESTTSAKDSGDASATKTNEDKPDAAVDKEPTSATEPAADKTEKDAVVQDKEEVSETASGRRASTAKDLLNKLKLEASEKTKEEGNKS